MKTRGRPWLGLMGLLMLLSACGHYAKLVEVSNESKKPIPRLWLLTSVALEHRIPDPDTEKRIPELLNMIGAKYRVTVLSPNASPPTDARYARCALWIKEQAYHRSLEEYNSIAALLTLTDPASGEVLGRVFSAVESEESVKSFQRLFLLLDELVKNASAELEP